MREITVTIGGRDLTLSASFKASLEIAQQVADPLTIAREAALEGMFLQQGLPYEPKWRFTVMNVIQILMIGLRAAGSPLKQAEVEELVFEAGFLQAKEAAGDYLALIVGPKPTEVGDKESGSGN